MAHNVEPMDVDSSVCDFDNKENSFHHSNMLSRTPCTEKGYEELDVTELNMKLRYSITPAASPMSKSFTANCLDNRSCGSGDNLVINNENGNLTRSLNSNLIKSDTTVKSQKLLPLQVLPSDQFADNNRNALRPLDSTVIVDDMPVAFIETNVLDDNLLYPSSSSSSMAHTPEAMTPTKEIPKADGASPIMRGLKSVFSMFRPSQSPIPSAEQNSTEQNSTEKAETFSPPVVNSPETADSRPLDVMASTPLAAHKTKPSLSIRNSPNRDSIVFNEDLERELFWKDETTILFSKEKVPIHKLFFQPTPPSDLTKESLLNEAKYQDTNEKLDSTVEYMDISYSGADLPDKTITDEISNISGIDSDSEFLDCETTFTKNKSQTESLKDLTDEDNPAKNISNSKLLEKSLNSTLSANSSEITISHCDIEASVNIKAFNTALIPQSAENIEKVEKIEDKQVTSGIEELTDIKHEDIIRAEHQPALNSTDDNMFNYFTPLEPTNLDLIKTTLLLTADNVKSDLVLETDLNVSKVNITQINETNVENFKDIVDSPPIFENIGVKSISQIPLIVDPRVLLFNIPSQVPFNDTQVSQEKYILNTSPADIPLPNDDDIEKVSTIHSTDLAHDNTVIIHESISFLNVNTKPENLEEQIEHAPLGDVIEAKLTENVICNNDEVCKIDLPAIITVEGEINSLNQIAKTDDSLLDPLQVKVEFDNKSIDSVAAIDLDDKAQDIQQKLPDFDRTRIACNEVNQNVPNSIACISKDEVIDSLKNEAELFCIGSRVKTPIDDIASKENQEVETEEKTSEKILEVPVDITLSGAVTESMILSEKEDNQDSEEIVAIQEEVQLQLPVIAVDNDVYIKDKLEAVTVPANLPFETTVNTNEVFSALEQENQINNATQPKNLVVSHSNKQLVFDNIVGDADIVAGDNVDIPLDINRLNHVTTIEPNDAIVPVNKIIMSTKDIEQIPSITTFSTSENEGNVIFNETHVHTTNQTETVVIPTNKIIPTELLTCDNNMPEQISAITVTDNVQVENIHTNQKQVSLEFVKELTINESYDTKTEAKWENIDEEVVASENNSPFVSVTAEELVPESKTIENFDDIENPFANSEIVQTPPSSPKIVSKGYNFNFDEIDDPFATKAKIRSSPPPGASPTQSFERTANARKAEIPAKGINKNRRKSQPERKKPITAIKRSNASFDATTYIRDETPVEKIEVIDQPTIVEEVNVDLVNNQQITEVVAGEKVTEIPNVVSVNKANELLIEDIPNVLNSRAGNITADESEVVISGNCVEILNDQNKSLGESMMLLAETKDTSSSEQSTYFSAGTSSNEGIEPKSVFNLPEMDDINFNPFMTMTKIRRSPSLSFETDNTDTTNSSKATEDKDTTVREVHTEDEDTVEGPFLETEELDEDKLSPFDGEMMQFNDMPAQENDDNTEAEELFIDAETFEFLLNQNQANIVADSGKESLFLKFDPLFAKRLSSEGVLAALSKVQERMNTPKKMSVCKRDETFNDKPTFAGPSTFGVSNDIDNNVTEECHEDVNITVSKPMMVVNPAVNPVVTCRNKSATTVGSNRRSLTFTSPAIAVIDRLLNLSSSNLSADHETSFSEANREQQEADRALTQLRELLADKEINVYNLRSESKVLKDRLTTLESQMKTLESVSEERLKKINELTDKLNEKIKINKSMASVVEECERTIASLISETEQDKKRHAEERIQLINERDEQTVHLTSMEVSFNDLHSKYEKSKQVILGFKANEDTYKKSIKDFEDNLAKMETNYELLKQHATSKLNYANDELQKMNRSHEADVLKMNALIKRKELHITSLEETLAQKTKANEELTAICDELINKVG